MIWPNKVAEKVVGAVSDKMLEGLSWALCDAIAQAALSSITLQDIAKLPDVKALLEAGIFVRDCKRIEEDDALNELFDALAPFTGDSNG